MTRSTLCVMLALVCAAAVGSRAQSSPAVFINEIHYDNTGTDTGEFVEIAGPAGTNLSAYSIVLYNGATGAVYDTDTLSGTIPNQQNGYGTVALSYPVNGIQNGAPDGIALVRGTGLDETVIQFLSYEASPFMAVDGPADGMTSTDIGRSENGSEAVGQSLQLQGAGTTYDDFTWAGPIANTSGAVNTGQSFGDSATPSLSINDVSLDEGDSGTVNATFTVSLTAPAGSGGVSFSIDTVDGSALAGSDYQPLSTTAAIPEGASTYSFSVAVIGDTTFEPHETFIARVGTVSGATVVDADGTATILNDDVSVDPPVVPPIVINELDSDTAGTDAAEFIELYDGGAGNTSLNGLVVVLFNGSNDLSYARFDLSGRSTDANGYFTLGNAAVSGVDLVFAGNFLQNGADAVALYAANAAAFPNNTAITTANLIDAVVYDTNDADDAGLLALLNAGQGQVDEDAGSQGANNSIQRCPNGGGGPRNTNTFMPLTPTPDGANSCAPPPVPRTIAEIQGDGLASPHINTNVITSGVVTGVKRNGFFLQSITPDSNDATSEGVFVFTGETFTVSFGGGTTALREGDLVDVAGRVVEFRDLTEITNLASVSLLSRSQTLPTPLAAADVFMPDALDRAAQLERYESMLVAADALTAVGPTNGFGEFYAVTTGTPRPFREPGLDFDRNLERIMVETDEQVDAAGLPRTPLHVSSGTQITGVRGPLDFAFAEYRIQVPAAAALTATGGLASAVPVSLAAADEFTIASANLLNFLSPNDDRVAKASLMIRTVLRTPAILGLIEIGDMSVVRQLRDRLNADAGTSYEAYWLDANPTSSNEQNVGYLVDLSRVEVIGEPSQLFAGKTFEFAGAVDTLHDRPPLVLEVNIVRPGTAQRFRVTVMLNHLRSLIDVESTAPFLVNGQPTGFTVGDRVREKRRLAAEDVADAIDERQGENLIVLGDLNAFEFSDGLVDVVGTLQGSPRPDAIAPSVDRWDHALFNLLDQISDSAQRYSYVFEGNAQTLDHVLVNGAMLARLSRFQYARSNADFPAALRADLNRPEAFSDHDVPVAYFTFPALADVSVAASGDASVQTGGTLTYSVTVSNAGPDAAANVLLSVPAVDALGDVSLIIPDGWSCESGTAVSCTTASLASGDSATFVIAAAVSCAAADGSAIDLAPTASTTTGEVSEDNNSAAVSVAAVNPAPVIAGVISPIVVSPMAGISPPGAIVTDAALGAATVTDNCASATLTRSGVPPGNVFPIGTTAITYSAIDSGGATATVIATVEVLTAAAALEMLAADLTTLAQQHAGTPLVRKIDAALGNLNRAIGELDSSPANLHRARALVNAASGVLGELVRRGELPAGILGRLEGVTWVLGQ